MFKELIKLAYALDAKGFLKEADTLDNIIRKMAADNDLDPDVAGDFRWDETPLNLGDMERDPRGDAEYHVHVPVTDHATGHKGLDSYTGRSKDIELAMDWIQTFPTVWKSIKKISLDNYNEVHNPADPTGEENAISLLLRYLPEYISDGAAYTAIERIEDRELRSLYDDGSDELPDGWVDPITPNYEPTREDIDWTDRKQNPVDTRPAMWFETDDDG